MKIVLLTLLVFLSYVSLHAQDNKESKIDLTPILEGNGVFIDDGCGIPEAESQLYTNRKGKITKIIDENEVIFEQTIADGNEEKERFRVELVGIDSKINKKNIILFLQKYVLNQNVEVTGNLRKKSDKKFKGLIFVASDDKEIGWINEYLLGKGVAQYKSFESASLVPANKPCQLQKAQGKAKTGKLGIWAK
jgi:hypothetical protein